MLEVIQIKKIRYDKLTFVKEELKEPKNHLMLILVDELYT